MYLYVKWNRFGLRLAADDSVIRPWFESGQGAQGSTVRISPATRERHLL